jgi:squalene-hopene cyclase-like protein
VRRAVEFLRALQDSNGGWWGRWTINDLASTAWVLRGLRAVGADLDVSWLRRGVAFLLDHQNLDGGWGESARSYRDLASIGRGPSTPGLTGLVLSALLEAGQSAEAPALARGFAYLAAKQAADGGWPNEGELHALLPPDLFYELPGTEVHLPCEALAIKARAQAARLGPPCVSLVPSSPPDSAVIEQSRQEGDPIADRAIAEIFARGELGNVNRLFRRELIVADQATGGGIDEQPMQVAAGAPFLGGIAGGQLAVPAEIGAEVVVAHDGELDQPVAGRMHAAEVPAEEGIDGGTSRARSGRRARRRRRADWRAPTRGRATGKAGRR